MLQNLNLQNFVYHWVPIAGAEETLLLLHGTGGDENDLLSLGQMLNPKANLLSPRGPVQENGMPRFFRRLAEGVFDIPDLMQRSRELKEFISAAAVVYGFDAEKVTAVGFSNGANIAGALLLLYPGVLKSAVLLHPMVPLTPDELPRLNGTRVFIGAGSQDPLVSPAETTRLSALLKEAGAEVTLFWSNGGHGLSREEIQAAALWIQNT